MLPFFKRLPLWAGVLLTCLLLFLLALAVLAALSSLAPDVDTDADIDRSL